MKKSIIIISTLLLVALIAGGAFAWGPGHGKGMGFSPNQDCPQYGGQNAFKGLSQNQQDELTALRQKFIDETYEFRSAKFQKHQEIKMLMKTSSPDRDKLSKLSMKITDLQKQIIDKRIDFQLAAKKIAPELGMGAGFRQGCGKRSGRGGQGYRNN